MTDASEARNDFRASDAFWTGATLVNAFSDQELDLDPPRSPAGTRPARSSSSTSASRTSGRPATCPAARTSRWSASPRWRARSRATVPSRSSASAACAPGMVTQGFRRDRLRRLQRARRLRHVVRARPAGRARGRDRRAALGPLGRGPRAAEAADDLVADRPGEPRELLRRRPARRPAAPSSTTSSPSSTSSPTTTLSASIETVAATRQRRPRTSASASPESARG